MSLLLTQAHLEGYGHRSSTKPLEYSIVGSAYQKPCLPVALQIVGGAWDIWFTKFLCNDYEVMGFGEEDQGWIRISIKSHLVNGCI